MPKAVRFISNLRVFLPAAAIVGLAVFATACGPSIHVATDYSHSTDFANYHTYSWLKVSAGNSLWDQRIRRDVNAQLATKGWMEVPSGGHAAVAAFAATREQPSLETFYNGFGPGFGGWYWNGFYGGGFNSGIATTQVVYTPIGSLTVDIFNDNTHHLIWRGTSTEVLSGNPEKNTGRLENAVAKMFRNFPPPIAG